MNHDVNLNSTECLVRMSDWGESTVTNICTGVVKTVEWGTMEYVGAVAIMILGLFILGMLVAAVWSILDGY